ncbi:hypothetical protein JCM8097_003935 [Rhodosporidiobolus ruineniae]
MLGTSRALRHSSAPSSAAVHRAFVSTSTAPSSQSESSAAWNRDAALYRRVFRTAARGADEAYAAQTGTHPHTRSRYLSQNKFKQSKVRITPRPFGVGRRRAALVAVDVDRLAASGSRRSFSSSAALRRVGEASLTEVEDDPTGGGFGGWDDAEGYGEAAAGKAKGKERQPGSVREGDCLETTRNGAPLLGVYLGMSPMSAHRGIILPTSGSPMDVSLDNVTFIIQSFVDPAIAARLRPKVASASDGTYAAPEDPATLDVIQSIRRLELAIESETHQLLNRGAGDLYRILLETPPPSGSPDALGKRKQPPPPPPSHITAHSALRALQLPLSPLDPLAAREERLLALHRILMSKPQHFVADPLAFKVSGRFDLRPRDEVDRFEQVQGWVRFRTKELEAWAEKAARVREWGRAARAKEESDGSTSSPGAELKKLVVPTDDPTFTWTPTDLAFLSFLRDSLAFERTLQEHPHMALAPTLVKLVDAAAARLGFEGWGAEKEVDKGRLRTFLAEVGVVAPWEDWTAHERTTSLEGWEERGQLVDRALDRAVGRAKSAAAKTATAKTGALTSTELYPSDPHDSVRHDFGAAKVYTIDDPGASELDDGISIAPAPASSSGKSTYWVHVHVADPTALLHPGHLLAKLARVRDHTVYFPEKTWPMLAESFTHGQKLSLGAQEGGEQRVVSLGIRIEDETGEVVESEVKAGIVRNVMRLTYAAVDEVLGYQPPPKGSVIGVGSAGLGEEADDSPQRPTEDASLSKDEVALGELRTLHRIASKLLKRRVESSAIAWQFPQASVSVSPHPLDPQYTTSRSPNFYASSPRVDLRLPSSSGLDDVPVFTDSPASLIVSELMVAANRSAARFAVERNLGVAFRQQGAPVSAPEDVEAIMALRNPDNGFVSGREVLKRALDFRPGTTLATPGPHWPMGINDQFGYVQVTSPLRRYSDLFAHYQLKSALLPASAASAFAPAFTGSAVQSHLDGFNAARKARHRLGQAAEAFWALWVIKHKLDLLRSVSLSSSASSSSSAVDPSTFSDADHLALDLLANRLTAVAIRPATYSPTDMLHVQRVLIPQLGLRATLRVDKAEMAPMKGEEVPVKVEEVVLAARSSLVVALKR